MTRSISHSEVSTLLSCQAAHDFKYVGQLAGSALRPKATAPLLRDGRAWGAGVAAWHQTGNVTLARSALLASLDEDVAEQRAHGLWLPDADREARGLLVALLSHYARTAERLPIDRLEHEIDVPIPSRTGRGRSNTYRLLYFVDGVHVDDDGRVWLVEFKLRRQLTAFEQVVLSRQIRWGAWAWRQQTGRDIAGVIVDERLKAQPTPVKLNKDGTPSKVQTCELDLYVAAWIERGEQPDEDVVARLAAKRWQARHPVVFRPGELDEAGRQLVSAAQQIRAFDAGALYPIRNPSPRACGGCQFRQICPAPDDVELVDALFERRPAKRDAPLEVAA